MQALDINFLRAQRTPGPLAWSLLLASVLGFAVVLLDAWSAQQELQAAQAQLDRRQRLALPSGPARPSAASLALSAEQVRVGQRLEAALERPWGNLLSDLETLSGDRVALIGLDLQADGQRLRLVGEAAQMADVVAYVRRLRALPATRGAALATHELRQDGAVSVVRFTVESTWGAAP